MKSIILINESIFVFAVICFMNISCKLSSPVQNSEGTRTQDSIEIANTIHEFYQWHHSKSTDTINDYNFVDDRGDRYRLIADLFQLYLDKLYSSGYLSRSFIQNEKNFYLECEKLWQHEIVGEVPSCMDGDHFFCAQEWDLNYWINTAITLDHLQSDTASVRMIGTSFDIPIERRFSLIREDGSWKMAYIECDRG
ncbi:MAG: DUF3828 domain-containing protein [Saprospiraceae bacterium]|nr:DUF3828 domain-containing protein [Saprospiraceae bacterium]